jgi:hypothetical protein
MQRDSLIFQEFSLVYSGNDVEEIMTSSTDFGNLIPEASSVHESATPSKMQE